LTKDRSNDALLGEAAPSRCFEVKPETKEAVMPDVKDLMQRIDTELTAAKEKVEKARTQHVQTFQEREKRLEKFEKVTEGLREVWKPRLEALAKKFGDQVNVTPTVEPTRREANFAFQSELAHIHLRFSVAPSTDATKVVFCYDLKVMPILMQFESHAELEQPLEAIDREIVTRWMDDRIVAFVRTYLSLHENEYYLKDHMVEDPVAHVRFPKYAAGATLELGGQKYYFVGPETRREFEEKNRQDPAKTKNSEPKKTTPAKQEPEVTRTPPPATVKAR